MAPEQKARNKKYFELHHELLYPAFLGAVLFEFVRAFGEKQFHFYDPLSLPPLLSLMSALWFAVYFSVAFLALAETTATEEQFSFISFFANLAEIALILYIAASFADHPAPAAAASLNSADCAGHLEAGVTPHPGPPYRQIFLGWLFIPMTAFVSNLCSGRTVRLTISIPAMLVGGIGLCLVFCKKWNPEICLLVLLMIMWLLLIFYMWSMFFPASRGQLPWERFDFKR